MVSAYCIDQFPLYSLISFQLCPMTTSRAPKASSSTSQYAYDVFLSFRGEDTRKTFTDHLYTALDNEGFRTFRDEEGIEIGEDIKFELRKAIQESRVSIVVFSQDYASSSWCLDELVTILKRKRTSGHAVLPVFYDVDPSHVRMQTGKYAETFARHEEQFKAEVGERKIEWMDKVKEWKAALEEVADLGGMVLKNQADGHESKFIQKIVKVVEDKLSRTILSVAPYLIGINSRAETIHLWLQDQSADVGMAAICGMGGIGKTTIAKFLFNLNFSRFEGSSFLANTREISEQHNGLIRLQRQLLSDILRGRKEKIYSIDEGIAKIKDAICRRRVLVVLDDVDKVEQLDAILGMRDWFFRGSKIIVTTRHERLLRSHEAYKIYMVEKLDDKESLELFSWHAFGQDHPTDVYEADSKRVAYYCAGLPLAVKVLGSSLSGRSLDVWKSQIEKLEAIPNSQILEKLKISFDSLQDDHDKNLFLHIACFFIRKDKDLALEILDNCDFYTTVGIQNLINRCLLRIDEFNKFRMHQLIQDMGRELIRQQAPDEPGKSSRIWNHEDSFNVLREKTGTESVEGLILDMNLLKETEFPKKVTGANRKRRFEEFVDYSLSSIQCNSPKRHHFGIFSWHPVGTARGNSNKIALETNAFAKMRKLTLLQLNFVQLNGSYEEFPKRLRWLCWHGFPFKSIPNDFPLESLVALDLRYSSLKNVGEGTKVFGILKILNLSHSHRLAKTPDFSVFPNLERLILKDCVSLVEVHESIGYLKRLTILNLKDCRNLRKFPRNIIMLKSLEKLNISGCSNLDKLPMELVKLKSLKVLDADRTALSQLLSTPGEVKSWHAFVWSWIPKPRRNPEMSWSSFPCSLVSLSLADCNLSNDSFPADFSHLSLLQKLNLSGNPICSLPDCVRGLTGLGMLRLESCTMLQSVVGLPRVDILNVARCTSLEKITYQSSSPQILDQTDCDKLVEITDHIKLEPIGKVDAEIINILGLQNLESMTKIEMDFFHDISMSSKTEKCPIQGLHEYGIFSTFFPGREVPGWFINRSTGCSISLTVPSLPNHRIRGLNVCSVYALSCKQEIWWPHPLFTKISNKSKGLKWIYGPSGFVIPKTEEEVIWLSHWKFGNQLEGGDEVNVTVVVDVGFQVKECGIDPVYEQEENSQNTTVTHSRQGVSTYGHIAPNSFMIGGAYFLSSHANYSCQGSSRKYHWTRLDWSKKLLEDSTATAGQEEEEDKHRRSG